MKGKKRSVPTPASQIEELEEYVERGLMPQALKIVRRILAKPIIDPKEFATCRAFRLERAQAFVEFLGDDAHSGRVPHSAACVNAPARNFFDKS